ncbi:MAG: cell division protein FtsQ [Rhodobacteraceae bacterium MED-G07]|nr:MAG: cell division protein FtsQ [Rhodobacteraceae bacterium MED-G07]
MRSLRQKVRGNIDPAPSRIAYRIMRLMLIPRLRLIFTLGFPSLLIFCATLGLFININVWENISAIKKDLKLAFVERPEFMIKVASIDGSSDELANEIREILPLDFPVSYFDLDIKYLHKVVNEIPAVASAAIKISVGGVLQITVAEKSPAFIWRKDNVMSVIDETGSFIRIANSRVDYPKLPLVVGEAANLAVSEISSLMQSNEYFRDHVRAFVRVGERRWDLILENNVRIMLPQREFLAAFDRLMLMNEAGSLLSGRLSNIDMRLVVRPTVRVDTVSVDPLKINSNGDL